MAGLWDRLTGGSLVDMAKVYVKPDAFGGHGAYARVPIKKGELVEAGIVRVHEGLDGNKCPYVFTWSEGEPRKWASGSGASVFYNMSADPNTHMTRHFADDAFQIHAARDIEENEELTHVYISAMWRECFKDLKPMAEECLKKMEEAEKNGSNGSSSGGGLGFLSCCSTRDKAADNLEPTGDVQMPKVLVKKDAYGGAGAFAKSEIKKGELIEKGIIRVLDLDGNVNPFVFTWSEGEPRKWGSGSGASVFYNMCADPNTHMTRDFAKNSFEIHALRDIPAGEELTHVYISATWRECFKDLKPMAEEYLKKQAEQKASEAGK